MSTIPGKRGLEQEEGPMLWNPIFNSAVHYVNDPDQNQWCGEIHIDKGAAGCRDGRKDDENLKSQAAMSV